MYTDCSDISWQPPADGGRPNRSWPRHQEHQQQGQTRHPRYVAISRSTAWHVVHDGTEQSSTALQKALQVTATPPPELQCALPPCLPCRCLLYTASSTPLGSPVADKSDSPPQRHTAAVHMMLQLCPPTTSARAMAPNLSCSFCRRATVLVSAKSSRLAQPSAFEGSSRSSRREAYQLTASGWLAGGFSPNLHWAAVKQQ